MRGRVLFSEYHYGCHALAVVHIYAASVREEESALANRLDSDVPEQGGGEGRVGSAGVDSRLYVPGSQTVDTGNLYRLGECSHK